MNVAIIGTGYVGLTTGACLAFVSGIADFITHDVDDLFGARLKDVA